MPSLTPVEITAWIGALFFLVAGWNQVEKFLDRRARRGSAREIQPQPLAVTQFDAPVTTSLCQARHREVSQEVVRLDQEVTGVRQERRREVSDLQQKINKVDREVGELRACIELTHQQLLRIDTKLDRMIERHHS